MHEIGQQRAFEYFYSEGLISDILGVISSGKEAIVFLTKDSKNNFFALKVYKDRVKRSFSNRSDYEQLMIHGHRREARAIKRKSKFGIFLEESLWQSREVDALEQLYSIGANVPKIYGASDNSFLMSYIGDERGHAKRLSDVKSELSDPLKLYKSVLKNMETFLSIGLVHGDLSPFNILYHQGDIVIIDFPQSLKMSFDNNSFNLLRRDFDNLSSFFIDLGVDINIQKEWNKLSENMKKSFSSTHWTLSKNVWSRGKV